MNDIAWLVLNLAFFTVYMILYILLGKFVLRLDVQPFIDRANEIAHVYSGKKATKQQKLACYMVVLFLVVTLLPSFLPASGIKTFLSQFGLIGATILLITITSFIYIDGKPICNWAKCATEGINWDLVIMFVATTPIANALESGDAGILTSIFAVVLPLIEQMGSFLYMIAVLAFFLIFTQFAHNIVLMIAFAPTLLSIGAQIGVNIAFLSAMICIIAQSAFLTPGASSQAAAVFGNTDWVDTKQAYKMSILIIFLSVLSVAICWPLGAIMF